MPGPDWNERYKQGDLPWDTNVPDEHLVQLFEKGSIKPCRTLEVGCGTGTNSIWLAKKGFSVLGVEVAEAAVEKARKKIDHPEISCEFEVLDFLNTEKLPGPFEMVFDRGCFHIFDGDEERNRFARHVHEVLKPDGIWISLIGSTEGAPRMSGPPRRRALDVVSSIEPHLEIVDFRSVTFHNNHPEKAKAWLCVARKREEAAQPPTHFLKRE